MHQTHIGLKESAEIELLNAGDGKRFRKAVCSLLDKLGAEPPGCNPFFRP